MQLGQDFGKAESSQNFKSQSFGIADMSIVINLLTKLYHNPKQTITQEYISNARDANREVKSIRPIEITAPTRFNPTMIIRDFGPGLSPERIKEVFLLYGASTKRQDDNQTGGFGIGAKSAWAYVDSFTIVSCIDGIKRTYVAHKSSGNGNLDQIANEKTKEPNGTAIHIPVKPNDIRDFKDHILRTIHFWNESEKPVLNSFEANDFPAITEEIKVSDIFSTCQVLPAYLKVDSYYNSNIIVIDGIPYILNYNFANKAKQYQALSSKVKGHKILRVNNGIMHVSPNREDLIDDEHNIDIINGLSKLAYEATVKYINDELNKEPEMAKALKIFTKLYQVFQVQTDYRGYTIDNRGIAPSNEVESFTNYEIKTSRKTQISKMHTEKRDKVALQYLDNLFYIDSITEKESNAKRGFRIRKALLAGTKVILINKGADKLIKDFDAKPLSDLDASNYLLVRAKNIPIQKKEFCAHYFTHGTLSPKQVKSGDFKVETVYAYMDENVYDTRHSDDILAYMRELEIPFFFVAKSNESQIKANAKLIHLDEWIKNHSIPDSFVKKWINKILRNDIDFNLDTLILLSSSITNKTLVTVLEYCKKDNDKYYYHLKLPKTFESKYKAHKLYKDLKGVLDSPTTFNKELETKIPLARDFCRHNLSKKAYKQHAIDYINSNI